MKSGKIVILGCGNGAGTPSIGNNWGKCDPNEPKNRRTRASVAILTVNGTILVDSGPDLREQLNRHNIVDVDAILYTHPHADHVHGIDEFTTLSRIHKKKYPVYGDADTLAEIRQRFTYMFESKVGFYPAVLEAYELSMNQHINVCGLEILPFEQDHGTRTSVGYRVGKAAYSTDMKRLNDAAFDTLSGIDTWIVDGAGYLQEDNPVHANLAEVYAYNERVGARRVIITHMARNMDYQTVTGMLPEGYEVAYDGMEIEFGI
jgi:phosphoribosyl 1,2-cyclic phosphate phosphodiesterase